MREDPAVTAANQKIQQEQLAAQRQKESEHRPSAMHRAIAFLLRQQAVNNPDTEMEAAHHLSTLDILLHDGLEVAQVIHELRTPTAPAPTPAPAPAPAPAPPEKEEPAADTAAALKTSKRFRRS